MLKSPRQHPETLTPEYRCRNFEEVEKNFNEHEALEEAKRCIQCKNPKCVGGCPVNINIPAFININLIRISPVLYWYLMRSIISAISPIFFLPIEYCKNTKNHPAKMSEMGNIIA